MSRRNFGPDVLPLVDDGPSIIRTPTDPQEAESVRLWKRERLKSQLAASQLAESHRLEIVGAIARVNERKDDLAAEHVTAAAPLQQRLATIEAEQIRTIRGRGKIDPALERERSDLLEQLRTLNADLERAIGDQDSLLEKLKTENTRFAREAGQACLLPAQFLETASLPLRVASKVATTSVNWATRRYETAKELHERRPTPFTSAELSEARRLLDAAENAAASALQACHDE